MIAIATNGLLPKKLPSILLNWPNELRGQGIYTKVNCWSWTVAGVAKAVGRLNINLYYLGWINPLYDPLFKKGKITVLRHNWLLIIWLLLHFYGMYSTSNQLYTWFPLFCFPVLRNWPNFVQFLQGYHDGTFTRKYFPHFGPFVGEPVVSLYTGHQNRSFMFSLLVIWINYKQTADWSVKRYGLKLILRPNLKSRHCHVLQGMRS